MPDLFGTEKGDQPSAIPEIFPGTNGKGLKERIKMLEGKFSTKALDKGYADQVADELMQDVNSHAYWQGVAKGVQYNTNLSESQRQRIIYSGHY